MPPRRRRRAAAAAAPAANADDVMRERVLRAYRQPGHPVAFSAPDNVAKHFGISKKKAKEYLEHNESYTLHREFKQPPFYNPYYVRRRREQVQGDLIDVSRLSRENDDVKFLLLLIDIMTKKVWVLPLKSKSAAHMKTAMEGWLDSLVTKPKIFKTDKGTEFTNRQVQGLLRSKNVEWQHAYGTLKACIAERANKSLQILLYKYMTEAETVRYIDKLASLVQTYNKRGHRTLKGMTPEEADLPQNEARVQAIFQQKYLKAASHRRHRLPFSVGDLVRIKTDPRKISSSSRAYAIQFHGEYFRIYRINRTLAVAMYYLRSEDTGDNIEGGFYAQELQRIRGDVYRIERVIRRRVRNGRRQALVKWRYYSDRWNEWIDEANITQAF